MSPAGSTVPNLFQPLFRRPQTRLFESPTAGKGGGVSDPASARFAAMTGTPDAAHKQYYRDFVSALQTAGVWDKIDIGYLMSDLDSQASTLNIKNPALFPLVPQNGPITHGPYQGSLFNGTNQYFKTGFIPSVHGAALAQDSVHIAAASLTERAAAARMAAGAVSTGSRSLAVSHRFAGDSAAYNTFAGSNGPLIRTAYGLSLANRSGATASQVDRNGVEIGTSVGASIGVTTTEIYVGVINNNGVPLYYSAERLAFFCIGASLTSAQKRALNNAVWTWMKAVGAAADFPVLVVADGNSLTSGIGGTGGITWPLLANGLLADASVKNVVVNKGVSGQNTPQMQADAATDIDPLLGVVASKKVLVAWELYNDINSGGATVTTAVDHLEAYCLARRVAGWEKIIVCNTLNEKLSVAWTAGTQAAVNAELASRYVGFADALVDLAAITELQDNTNTTYWSADQVHLVNAGYALVAAAIQTAVQSVL